MAQCVISGTIQDLAGNAMENAIVEARTMNEVELSPTVRVVNKRVSTVTSSAGAFSLSLLQNAKVILRLRYTDGTNGEIATEYAFTVPTAATANLNDLI